MSCLLYSTLHVYCNSHTHTCPHTLTHTYTPSLQISEDPKSAGDHSSDDDEPQEKPKPAPGKKTRGRVKIPMEYIKNKLRRYTTFSKRKSNIMKKAYELSTLTGTQVRYGRWGCVHYSPVWSHLEGEKHMDAHLLQWWI